MAIVNNSSAAAGLESELGYKLRLRRKIRRRSLQSIADASGISVAQLSLIERGLSQPSLRTLRQICETLRMPVSWLFDNESAVPEGGIVVRSHQRRRFDLGRGGVAKELMTGDNCSQIQAMQITIPPGGSSGHDPFKTGPAARCGVVVQGTLGLEVDGESFVLEKDDSFAFEKRETCRMWNGGDGPCVVFWSVAPAIY